MDLFDQKAIKPMLIKEMQQPFNSPDWIYELKLDGIRCIAYLDETSTDLRNKRDMNLLPRFTELKDINLQVKSKCILDGELVILKNKVPDFYELQRRTLLTDKFKIELSAKQFPANYVVYDILYLDGEVLNSLPLSERKKLLNSTIIENNKISVSRYINEFGIELFELTKQQELEGVVAKRLESKYYFDKRTVDWIKFKRMADEDFVVCGFVKNQPMLSIVLGQYKGSKLIYKGSVSYGVKYNALSEYQDLITNRSPFDLTPLNDDNTIWLEPKLVCVVEYMPNTKNSLRQPVFKGFRDDVSPLECQIKES